MFKAGFFGACIADYPPPVRQRLLPTWPDGILFFVIDHDMKLFDLIEVIFIRTHAVILALGCIVGKHIAIKCRKTRNSN